MRKNDKKVIAAVAAAAGLPESGFFVELEGGFVLVNHPESMKWPEKWAAIEAAVWRVTGKRASVT